MKVRLIPKIPLRSNLRKLLKKYFQNPHSLGKYENHVIARYLNSKNEVVSKILLIGVSKFFFKRLSPREATYDEKTAQTCIKVNFIVIIILMSFVERDAEGAFCSCYRKWNW